MSIEINRARVAADGTVSCEFVFPNIGSFVRVANDAMRVEPAAFAPREATAPAYSHAQATYEAKHAAAEIATCTRIPRATVPPFVADLTTLGGNAYPPEEPEGLTAGRAYEAHELKAGGTD